MTEAFDIVIGAFVLRRINGDRYVLPGWVIGGNELVGWIGRIRSDPGSVWAGPLDAPNLTVTPLSAPFAPYALKDLSSRLYSFDPFLKESRAFSKFFSPFSTSLH
jgi:hypothetical protein